MFSGYLNCLAVASCNDALDMTVFTPEANGLGVEQHLATVILNDFTKIVVRVDSEEELEQICKKAVELDVKVCEVIDSGKTEFNNVPTKTCVALGPDKASILDQITGDLKLL